MDKLDEPKVANIGVAYRDEIINLWKTKESADFIYYTKGETEDWLKPFWASDSIFLNLFSRLDTTRCAEIASGFGRHSAQIVTLCQELYLVDTSVDAVAYAQNRFKSHPHVKVILSQDGTSMPGIPNEHLTSIFSYDAMVHFEPLTIVCYLAEINRTLKRGGMALLHHSNYSGNPMGKISTVIGARNYMSQDLFAHFCSRNGLRIVDQHLLDWSFPKSDALTLVQKI